MPRITPDGQVLMDLEVRQDAVAAGNAPVPAINTNTIATQVRLANRETLVLGGIFSDQVSENESGVPGLSRIPGVGKLFRQTRHSTQRSELLLFITPVIIPAH
jgi:type IV pilus assembly protein PilQ